MPPYLRKRINKGNHDQNNYSSETGHKAVKLKPKKLKKVRERKVKNKNLSSAKVSNDERKKDSKFFTKAPQLSSEDSFPMWAETTFDRLRRGTIANLKPPACAINNLTYNSSAVSSSSRDGTLSFARKEEPIKIFSPKMKQPKRQYKNKRLNEKENLIHSPIWHPTLSEDDINKYSLIVEQEKSVKSNLMNSLKTKLGNTLEISSFSYSSIGRTPHLQASTPNDKDQTPIVNTEYSLDNFYSYEKRKSGVVKRGKISDSNCKTNAIRIMGEKDFSSDLFSASDQSLIRKNHTEVSLAELSNNISLKSHAAAKTHATTTTDNDVIGFSNIENTKESESLFSNNQSIIDHKRFSEPGNQPFVKLEKLQLAHFNNIRKSQGPYVKLDKMDLEKCKRERYSGNRANLSSSINKSNKFKLKILLKRSKKTNTSIIQSVIRTSATLRSPRAPVPDVNGNELELNDKIIILESSESEDVSEKVDPTS